MPRIQGFSTLECLIVVAVIALLAGLSIPYLVASHRAALEAQAISNLRTVGNAQITFYTSQGRFALPRELVEADYLPRDAFLRGGSGAGEELSDGDYFYSVRYALHSSGITLDGDPSASNAAILRRFRLRLGRTAVSRGGGEGVMLVAPPSTSSPPSSSYRPLGAD